MNAPERDPRKTRVVFGLNDLAVGGMERQFVEQMRFFDRDRFDLILITLFQFPGEPSLYDELPSDLPVYQLAFKGKADVRSWFRLYRLLRELKPDIVVSSLFFANTAFRTVRPLVGYQAIAREHNTYVDKPSWQRLADRMLARRSYRIVAVSKTVADFTARQERIPREKFVVIHNGIDAGGARAHLATLPSRDEVRETLGIRASDHMLLDVARFVPQKNHRLLIDGFLKFRATHPDYRLVLMGMGGLRHELEAHATARGGGDSILFFGNPSDRWTFFKAADAFVSASDIEGLSNTFLEAFASGLPLVATMTAGTDELLRDGENGFSIQERTPRAVATALEKLASADRRAMQEACLSTVAAFDMRETVAAYERLFIDAAART